MAEPKSVSTTRPFSPISTLPGLMSRCSTPTRLAAFNAESIATPMRATSRTGSGPSSRMISSSDRDCTYSMTIHGRIGSSTTS
jgi:hypothetical protein